MNPVELLETAALLGLFVAFAGAYGVLYALGRLRRRRRLRLAAYLSYGLQCLVTVAVLRFTPLGVPWKLLVAFSCLAYLGIPPVTWRYLESTHRSGEIDHAAQSP